MIRSKTGVGVDLIRSSGGVFEIAADGVLLYSKKKTGEFPEDGDIVRMIKSRKS